VTEQKGAMMNAPRIQSDDRGITINKTLAWMILGGLLTAGLYGGTQVHTLQTAVDRQAEDRKQIQTNAKAISDLQRNNATTQLRLNNIERYTSETRADVAEVLSYLRRALPHQQGLPVSPDTP